MTARPIRRNAQTPDRNGKIFYTSTTSLSHISKNHRVTTGSWKGAGTAALNGMGDGALSGAVTGTITGATGSAVKVSQAAKAWDKGTFKSGYQSMKYHYNKHVISEEIAKGNNVLKYTQDAIIKLK